MGQMIQMAQMPGGAVALLAAAVVVGAGVGATMLILRAGKAVLDTFRRIVTDGIAAHENSKHSADEVSRSALHERFSALVSDLVAARDELRDELRRLREEIRGEIKGVREEVGVVHRRLDDHIDGKGK